MHNINHPATAGHILYSLPGQTRATCPLFGFGMKSRRVIVYFIYNPPVVYECIGVTSCRSTMIVYSEVICQLGGKQSTLGDK